jgi:hypothetical protein
MPEATMAPPLGPSTIKVSRATREGLGRVILAREQDLGRNVTLTEAIEFLIDFWENH